MRCPESTRVPCRPLGLAACATWLLAGCVTVQDPDGGRPSWRVFDGPPDLDTELLEGGTQHSVKLVLEIDPAKDLPPGQYRPWLVPRFLNDVEYFGVEGIHEITYWMAEFDVGGFRYPAEPGAWLFVFKRRDAGTFEITFRGRRIQVPIERSWIPSIYYRRDRGPKKRVEGMSLEVFDVDAPDPWMHETLRIGLARIEADSRWDHWEVDGSVYQADEDEALVLDGALRFESR